MCGPFKGCQGILRLLEIIFCALALIIVIFRGKMVSPWGIWCEFVWVFCIIVPVVLIIVEHNGWHILFVALLPNWSDLTCGLTVLCFTMIFSATIIFGVVFFCLSCIVNILCVIISLVATVIFLIDTVMQAMKLPSGYLSSRRGNLRITEAFIACIIITAAADHFITVEWAYRPIGMLCSVAVFAVCLVATVLIIVLNLLKLLQCLVAFKLKIMELVFNVVAVILYLVAICLWAVFGYKRSNYNPYICDKCSFKDLNCVTIGASVNVLFYIVDLCASIRAR
ncbi:myeloid-associated differentiation marker-like protein 2 [Sphaeramia orbicularis]|uniref:myeloid-associated differentiation marker-like protein 2 n=1 Tax=Sphaeramia orbicularis TaxID=375764 RepID=UPI00117F7E01|nr:myeloid-associated differentiation marker-like protein 2 [Sphaeramia orbicularis]